MAWTQVCFRYDGSFAGFLSCVFDSYAHRELPAAFAGPDAAQFSLFPERTVPTDRAHAGRVYRSLAGRISPQAQRMVSLGFLTCLPQREMHLWRFIRLGYRQGARVTRDLAEPRVAVLNRAILHLEHEAHLLKGFLRFSDQGGVLTAEIEPKNRVLPLLGPHFCARFSGETFLIYDRTHREALFHRTGGSAILPMDEFSPARPGREELDWRALWRRFYDTIAIEGRRNPALQRTHLPLRYRGVMTEFLPDPAGAPLPPAAPARQHT